MIPQKDVVTGARRVRCVLSAVAIANMGLTDMIRIDATRLRRGGTRTCCVWNADLIFVQAFSTDCVRDLIAPIQHDHDQY
jgi:hypothetical protein